MQKASAHLRRERLTMMIQQKTNGNKSVFAQLVGKKASQISDMLSGNKSFGEKVARYIEKKAGYPERWLDGEVETPLASAAENDRPASSKLRFYLSRTQAFHRLPFVASRKVRTHNRFWYVSASGDYGGGVETGQALALLFLRYLRKDQANIPARLGWIVESMMNAWTEEGGQSVCDLPVSQWPENLRCRRGQMVGFFTIVEEWLTVGVTLSGARLEQFSEESLLRRANQAERE